MIVYNVQQGTQEWAAARRGIPTASNFHKILTPGGKPSEQAKAYLRHLIAELIIGVPLDAPKTSWMERGNELEGEAVCFYEYDRDIAVQEVGFITDDLDRWGASPDRLIGEDGLLEIKCPSPEVHVAYMLYKDVDAVYRVQLQGQLFVAERDWTDICSYHPLMDPVIVRVGRDEEFIGKLKSALEQFTESLESEKARLKEMGYKLKDRERQHA